MPAITDLPVWVNDLLMIHTQGTATTTPTSYTYNGTMNNYIFRNDGSASITLNVNSVNTTVTAGETVTGGSLSSFSVTASSGSIPFTIRALDSLQVNAVQYGWNGSTTEMIRVPNVWKYASNGTLAGTTGVTVWTPASGKKYRVMGVTLQSSVSQAYFLRDAGSTFQMIYPPANEGVTIYLGNGYLANAANTNLELYNSGSTTATVRISLFGTEE